MWHAITDSIDSVYTPHTPWPILMTVSVGLTVLAVTAGAALYASPAGAPLDRTHVEVRMNTDVLSVRSARTDARVRRTAAATLGLVVCVASLAVAGAALLKQAARRAST